jgi:hypothetical protein
MTRRVLIGAALLALAIAVATILRRSPHEAPYAGTAAPRSSESVSPAEGSAAAPPAAVPPSAPASLAERIAERRKAVEAVLRRLFEHYKTHVEPWENHEHVEPCEECRAYHASDADRKYNELEDEYTREGFRDTASILALIEIVRTCAAPELRDIACRKFNYWRLEHKKDKEMAEALLEILTRPEDAGIYRIVVSCLVALRESGFSPEQRRLIMNAVETSHLWKGYSHVALIAALIPYVNEPDVKEFLIYRALERGSIHAVHLLAYLPHDPEAYRVVAELLFREDRPDLQKVALYHLSRGLNGADLSPANPLAVDYVARLAELYPRTGRKEVREQIVRRLIQFDIPRAAEEAGRLLRDESLAVEARSMALSDIVFLAGGDDHKLYPNSLEAWLTALEGVGSDRSVSPAIRTQAFMARMAALQAHGASKEALREECTRIVKLLESDPNSEVRARAAAIRQRARKYGLDP